MELESHFSHATSPWAGKCISLPAWLKVCMSVVHTQHTFKSNISRSYNSILLEIFFHPRLSKRKMLPNHTNICIWIVWDIEHCAWLKGSHALATSLKLPANFPCVMLRCFHFSQFILCFFRVHTRMPVYAMRSVGQLAYEYIRLSCVGEIESLGYRVIVNNSIHDFCTFCTMFASREKKIDTKTAKKKYVY